MERDSVTLQCADHGAIYERAPDDGIAVVHPDVHVAFRPSGVGAIVCPLCGRTLAVVLMQVAT